VLADLIRASGVDVIHARSRAPAWSGHWASKATGIPFITTYHGSYNEDFPFKRRYNAVMAKGRPTIAVSQFIAQMIRDRHGLPDDQIVTIPRGADLNTFDPDAMTGMRIAQLADRWGLTDEVRPIFMLPGRLTRWKGQEVFIDACAILREKRGPGFLGIMVGGAPDGSTYPDDLIRQAQTKNCADCVKLVGSCNDMAAAYRLAGCAISASTDPEAFGRVAVEAQAMGRPVIATDHGGARETVDDGVTGALVEPGNAEAMADAMDAFLNLDDELRERIGVLAHARVKRHFSTRRMTDATLDVYETVLETRFPNRTPI
jgi:glycosyltransferase involved in cell wall biosynthesis